MRLRLVLPLALIALLPLAACRTPQAPKPSRSAKVGPKPVSAKPDELRLWTDKTPAKLALVSFIEDAADRESAAYVPPSARVAVLSESAAAAAPAPALRELVALLRANSFRVYLVTTRPAADRAALGAPFGLGADQVVGPYPQSTYKLIDGVPSVVPLAGAIPAPAPVLVHQAAGSRPVLALVAADSDRDLLDYATLRNPLPSLGLVVSTPGSETLAAEAAAHGRPVLAPADWRR